MAALYELTKDFEELYNSLEILEEENGDISDEIGEAWFDTLEAMELEIIDKGEAVGIFYKRLKAEAEAIKAEEEILRKRRKAKELRMDSLKKYIMNCMSAARLKKIDTARICISVSAGREKTEIIDEREFIKWAEDNGHKDLLKYKAPEISLTMVKEAIKSGMEIPLAEIVKNPSLTIK